MISAVPGRSEIVIGSQTITQGGSALTLADAGVISVAPSGVIVSNTENGVVISYTIPSAKTTVPSPQTLGVVAGNIISGLAIDSSQAVAAGYTLSIGGAVATLSGNQVVSLGASGIVVQAPGGIETTLSVPIPSSDKGTYSQSSVADQLRTTPTSPDAAVGSSGDPQAFESSTIMVTASFLSKSLGSPSSPNPSSESLPASSFTQTGPALPTGSSISPVTSTGLGGVIYNTFQGNGSKASYFGFLGTMLGLVISLLYALN